MGCETGDVESLRRMEVMTSFCLLGALELVFVVNLDTAGIRYIYIF